MREIKFRAWDTETKEMSYDFLDRNWLKVCIESPFMKLMQYTGLKDKNGKEIYEKDILRNIRTGKVTIVNWHGTMAGYISLEPRSSSVSREWGELFHVFDRCEIIGNIYENPELLEVA